MRPLLAAAALVGLLYACGSDGVTRDDTSVPAPSRRTPDGGTDAASPADAGLACPAGTTLQKTLACDGTTTTAPASLASALAAGAPGDVVDTTGFDEPKTPCLPALVCTPDDAPALLFSDSPESPSTDGVLYADTVAAGNYRIYVYHANGGADARKFPVVVLNRGAAPATVTIHRRGLATPSQDYVAQGKAVVADWLTAREPKTRTVPPGERIVLDGDLDALGAEHLELVHAVYDVTTSAELKFSVVSLPVAANAATATAGLSLLGRDPDHQRGTFAGADVLFVADPSAGPAHLRLGGDDADSILIGTDRTTGDTQKLLGNYGVQYRFSLGAGVGAITPRGGAWGGALTIGDGAPVLLPASTTSVATGAVVVGKELSALRLLTAGGSSLPVDFFVLP